ncbi:MAG TPA: hypothetical protein VJQ06_08355 [Rhizomicrobium sp.]|nr:hypothetical protein [Rhizomicrobium sp.]
MMLRRLVLSTLAVAFALPGWATPLPRYGVFVYSNLCWGKESGDAAGNRLMLIRDGDGDRLFWEWSDGPLEGPVAVTSLHLDGGHIAFDVDIGSQDTVDGAGKFAGKEKPYIQHLSGSIFAEAIVLGSDGTNRRERLPRLVTFAAKTGECH